MFQELETLDNGKAYTDSIGDVELVIDTFRYYAGWADKITGQTIPVGKLANRYFGMIFIPRYHTVQCA